MKISEQWLREWVNPKLNSQQLASQLIMAGIEVEAIVPAANSFDHVVVGEVLDVKPHPDADRLRVCQVKVGEGTETLQIVCGASNVYPGLKAPVALVGAKLNPELIIKKAKLRGVESSGMLCSATELGLAETSNGLFELPADAPIGMDIRHYLKLDDQIVELKITPNRGDCLSIAGIAREVAALNDLPIQIPSLKTIPASKQEKFPIKIIEPTACTHYISRVIHHINPKAKTPTWMQERLRRSGIRSIHPAVDVTNYVMLELGQPLHAFDLSKINKEIIVRYAELGERIDLLDGQQATLDTKTLVIADHQHPLAIAGVMGGSFSAVNEATIDILLESAFFSPIAVSHAVQHYHISSDSAQRFERGVDPQLQAIAIERATELILAIAGGEPGLINNVVATLKKPVSILLRRDRIQRVLGIAVLDHQVENILNRLGMICKKANNGWEVTPPSYRFDMVIEADLIEEIARIVGYDNIPTHLPTMALKTNTLSETTIDLKQIRQVLIDRGYHEAITYSFVSEKLQQLLDPQQTAKKLSNPLSTDLAVMRTSLWSGLLAAVLYNQNRQEQTIRLFETGLCFFEQGADLQQVIKIAGIVVGPVCPEQWGIKTTPADFYDVKNDLEVLLSLNHKKIGFKPDQPHSALHPQQQAAVYLNNKMIGHVGVLHPAIAKALDVKGLVYLFELDLSALQAAPLPRFADVSKFPSVRRDLAFIITQEVPVAAIQEKIVSNTNELLKNLQIFDIYHGQGVGLGNKSVALGLSFQHPTRTLTDSEINDQLEKIVTALGHAFAAKLRE
jgi:phenylalanyl-tRNA synthetase beta chain